MNPTFIRRTARPTLAITTVLAAFLLVSTPARAADNDGWWSRMGRHGVEGSGNVKTETRVVEGFQGIELLGSMDLVLRQGAREGVELRGDDNVLSLIETRVVDRDGVPTLAIGTQRGGDYSTRRPVVVTVDLKTLGTLKLAGAGDVRSDALKTPQLRVSLSGSGNLHLRRLDTDDLTSRISGSGDMQFAGRAAHASFRITGSGDVDASALESDDVSVDIAGSGDASVTARKSLAATIAGSGDVTYAGDPTVKRSIAGSGSVRRR